MKINKSLKGRLLLVWGLLTFSIAVIGILVGSFTYKRYESEYLNNLHSLESLYVQHLDHDVDDITNVVNSIYLSNNYFLRLTKIEMDDFDRIGCIHNLMITLQSNADSIDNSVGLFYFDRSRYELRSIYSAAFNDINKGRVDTYIKNYINKSDGKSHIIDCVDINDESYLFYAVKNKSKYVGYILDISHYFDEFPSDALIFTSETGIAYEGVNIEPSEIDEKIFSEFSQTDDIIYKSYDYKRFRLESWPICLIFIKNLDILKSFSTDYRIIILVIICPIVILSFLLVLLHILNRALFHPMDYILERIQELKDGQDIDFHKRDLIKQDDNIIEFNRINRSIDDLLAQISDLEQQKYEEAQKTNLARLQYYKLQINPHFYLNCLNIISTLIDKNSNVAAKEMILGISKHFRYVFQDQRNKVTLREEINETKTYADIYSLKGGIPILVQVNVPEELMETLIPPLVLETFAENSIKHRNMAGQILCLSISAKKVKRIEESTDFEGVSLTISDNGEGFPKEIIDRLNEPVSEFKYESDHIGIDNLKYRMKLLYKENTEFHFYNKESGGAVCEIIIWGL